MKIKMVSLSNNEEFKSIIRGKRINNKYFTIFFKRLINKNTQFLNISFVTKRKIGNAVKRNKIKRRLRNIMNDAIKITDIKSDKLRSTPYVFAKKTVATPCIIAVPSILIVAPRGTVNDATDLFTPKFSSTVFKLIGIVAALLDVENANSIEFFIL